jgi:hypothetical protein
MSLLLSLISLFVCLLIFLQRKLKLGRLSRWGVAKKMPCGIFVRDSKSFYNL